jgi:hypothetical protein
MNPPSATPEEIFRRLLDESFALLASPESAGIAIADDELHREIIVPLLPAMLADKSIRQHWSEQAATGFPARIGRHFENGGPAPRWTPADFEIHVTASYSAGPDARALADTLLSEDSLRDLTAALMNQLLDALWPSLAPAPPDTRPPSEPVSAPAKPEQPATEGMPIAPEPKPEISGIEPLPAKPPALTAEPEMSGEVQFSPRPPHSQALVRTLCRKFPVAFVRRKLAANTARDNLPAILARRILRGAKQPRKKSWAK